MRDKLSMRFGKCICHIPIPASAIAPGSSSSRVEGGAASERLLIFIIRFAPKAGRASAPWLAVEFRSAQRLPATARRALFDLLLARSADPILTKRNEAKFLLAKLKGGRKSQDIMTAIEFVYLCLALKVRSLFRSQCRKMNFWCNATL